jgi:hypothetical protein
MKRRPHGFLRDDAVPHDSEVFDYIVELHGYLWRVVNVAIPDASGCLGDYLPEAIEILEASALSSPQRETP